MRARWPPVAAGTGLRGVVRPVTIDVVSWVFPCPCCGHLTFAEGPGSYEICPV
ncbi:CPCC family cysteine-rich protein [Micromonospora sp. NPDC047548]|uniref:CPCC family cysteine-rich protein n=1 Tax=Micromonospora sp. NPDC047548 TaxID=3155624 RepID=UPI0033D6B13C